MRLDYRRQREIDYANKEKIRVLVKGSSQRAKNAKEERIIELENCGILYSKADLLGKVVWCAEVERKPVLSFLSVRVVGLF